MNRILHATIFTSCVAIGCHTATVPHRPPNFGLTYHNGNYGLSFSLPASWDGYSVLTEQWNSEEYDEATDKAVPTGYGPVIILRHPRWKADAPYQDIPILVFTRAQWSRDLQEGIFAGGVVDEISHNSRYVFAAYSRFNADDSVKGWEEAERIVELNQGASRHLRDER